jgi:sec-independent protein translocase protein TatA
MFSGLDNPLHLLIIALVVMLLFGARRLPELGRSLGTGMREFKSGILGEDRGDAARD